MPKKLSTFILSQITTTTIFLIQMIQLQSLISNPSYTRDLIFHWAMIVICVLNSHIYYFLFSFQEDK